MYIIVVYDVDNTIILLENNLALQQRLYDLRSETKDAFDEAKQLEARWKDLEKEQREVYQVMSLSTTFLRKI